MGRKLLIVLAVVLIALGSIYAIGLALPVDHTASASATIAAPVDKVAALIRNVDDYPSWRRGVTKVEILESNSSASRTLYREHGDEPMTFRLEESARGQEFRSTITDENLGFGGEWTIRLTREADSTAVAIQENGTVSDPIFRFFGRFVIGYETTMVNYLEDLDAASAPK